MAAPVNFSRWFGALQFANAFSAGHRGKGHWCRTLKLSSGGLLGIILGKPMKGPPSAAADCSACLPPARLSNEHLQFMVRLQSLRVNPFEDLSTTFAEIKART